MTDVDFGYKKVAPQEKTRLVRGVFESVAENYDLMNDVMSFGTHRLFKRMTLEMSGVRPGHKVLDLAGGTGDLAALFAPVVGSEGQVVLADINCRDDAGRSRPAAGPRPDPGRLLPGQRRTPAVPGRYLQLHHHRLRAQELHRQAAR